MGEAPEECSSSSAPRTLLFVSRQQLLAEAVGRVLEQDGAWSVSVLDHDHPDLLELAVVVEPSVVLIDVDTHVIPGLTLTSNLVAALPRAAVLVLGEIGGSFTAAAIGAGARGCLTYSASPEEVRQAIDAAAAGRTTIASAALRGLIGGRTPQPRSPSDADAHLSAREIDVLRLLAAGRSSAGIAAELGISVQTVRKHTQNILGKLGVHSKLAAAAVAVREGLV